MLEHTIVVRNKSEGGFMEFIKQLFEYKDKGYEPDWNRFVYKSQPHYNHAFALTVFKKELADLEAEEAEKINLSILDDKKSSKDDLLKLALDIGIEIPEDKAKYPAGIRKYIKEQLDNNNK